MGAGQDKDASTPRLYLMRHGETEWTINGRMTSFTDLPLTADGETQVAATGKLLIGPGKLIQPQRIAKVFVSPRIRATKTLQLAVGDDLWEKLNAENKIEVTEKIVEWDHGRYEGMQPHDVRTDREARGLDKDRKWDIALDGCEDGESPEEATERLDSLIQDIRAYHVDNMRSEKPGDVVVVAHGRILRSLVMRWLGLPLNAPAVFMMDPGAVCALSYYGRDPNRPSMMCGLAVPTG